MSVSHGCETSFITYTFSYQWTVHNLIKRLCYNQVLESPVFDGSPEGATPATKWRLELSTLRLGNKSQVSLKLVCNPQETRTKEQPKGKWSNIWVETCTRVIVYGEKVEDIHPEFLHNNPIKMPKRAEIFNLSLSKLSDSLPNVRYDCDVTVLYLDDPIHVDRSIHVPEFNLGGKLMEENRRKNLFTDVTLLAADKKEFRAHKVILAAQSNFFETHLSSDKVKLTDVPGNVMEVMLSYMYTGEVAAIEEVAISVLPFAEKYGLEGLMKMCEQSLAKSLTNDNAVDLLITANAHNALDLKRVSMDYISSNVGFVRKREGWKKLKERQDCHNLWVEVLENVAERA